MDSYLILILSVLIVLLIILISRSGKTYPILILFAITYFVQYIIAPYYFYNFYPLGLKAMGVGPDQYFAYAIPALLFLFAAVYLFSDRTRTLDFKNKFNHDEARRYGWFLVAISFLMDILAYFQFSFLVSIVSFTIYLKYVGCFCLVLGRSIPGFIIIGLIYARLMFSVLAAGVFIEFFIWSAYLFLFIVLVYRLSFLVRLLAFVSIIPVIITVQSVKKEYRELVWTEKEEASLELLMELSEEQQMSADPNDEYFASPSFIRTISRLNQGWHLSLTLRHVPDKQPFVNGAELYSDILASIVPRFLFEGKKTVNDKEKFEKYTGHHIYGRTAMSIGVLGDFYVNFGYWGAFIGLFGMGVFVALVINYFMRRFVVPNPLYLVWIPFLFSYLIRANNEFYIFFNNIVKGFILFFVIDFVYRQMYGYPKRRIEG